MNQLERSDPAGSSVEATRQIAAFVAGTGAPDIPRTVKHKAKRCLVDALGVALAGSANEGATILARTCRELAPGGSATVVGARNGLPHPFAALVNGFQMHVLDYDDTYNPGLTTVHGSSPVWPAIWAASELRRSSGSAALRAFVLGWETEVRIARAAGPYHYDVGWHVTGTVGHLGAAAAVGALLGLGERQVRHALGTAGTQSAGLKEVYGSHGKAFHPGKAAMDGLLAAILTERGFTSTETILEGKVGFWNVLSRDAEPRRALDGLGETWELLDDGFKAYSCGSLMHPTIDAIISLRRDHQLDPNDVVAIEARANALLSWVMAKGRPATGLDGKFSSSHCAAVAMVDGAAGLSQFTDERVDAPEVVAMRERVRFDFDDTLPKDAATVTLSLSDGRELTRETKHNKGTPANPMSDAELSAKFTDNAQPTLGAAGSRALLDLLWRFDEIEDVGEVLRACRPADPRGAA